MPDEATEVTTPPAADNVETTTDADPREGASKGISDRLDRLEKKLTRERVQPLQDQINSIRAKVEEQGLDVALFGFTPDESAPEVTKTEAPKTQDVELLRLKAAYNAGLPPEVLPLITATTEAEIQAQVAAVKTLNPRAVKRSPIATAPDGTSLPTYRRSQMQDAAFYIKNMDDIHKAMKDGRFDNDS